MQEHLRAPEYFAGQTAEGPPVQLQSQFYCSGSLWRSFLRINFQRFSN